MTVTTVRPVVTPTSTAGADWPAWLHSHSNSTTNYNINLSHQYFLSCPSCPAFLVDEPPLATGGEDNNGLAQPQMIS